MLTSLLYLNIAFSFFFLLRSITDFSAIVKNCFCMSSETSKDHIGLFCNKKKNKPFIESSGLTPVPIFSLTLIVNKFISVLKAQSHKSVEETQPTLNRFFSFRNS